MLGLFRDQYTTLTEISSSEILSKEKKAGEALIIIALEIDMK